VGIEITQEDGLIKIVSPIEGSPADRAGLKTNDLITKIDDTAVKGLSLNDAVKRMRGEPNTKVTLTIFRKDENRTFPVTITREEIKTQSVKGKVIEPGYAWIRLSQFQERTVDDFVRKVEEIYKQDPNLKGLVLDLRNDPGGLLDAAVAISAAFLPENVTVVSTNGQLAESKATYKASPEFYARARQRPAQAPACGPQNRAAGGAGERRLGIGQRNRGRRPARPQARHHHGQPDLWQGLGANRAPLGPDTGIKLTTARYYTPSGKSIQAKGIVPDVMVDETSKRAMFAALRMREADLDKHLGSGQGEEQKGRGPRKGPRRSPQAPGRRSQEAPAERKMPEFGTDKDFQLTQALNQLKGRPCAGEQDANRAQGSW
jgi:carboxyl-terminal processing protease